MLIFGIWFWLFDWKQKEVLSCHVQSVLAKRPRLPMPLILNTGAAVGSCSLWVLASRELAFVLSESYQQRLLLALGYETQMWLLLSRTWEQSPFPSVGCSCPKQGCRSSLQTNWPLLLHRDHKTPQAALRFLSRAMQSFPQTNWKNDCNANLLELQSPTAPKAT